MTLLVSRAYGRTVGLEVSDVLRAGPLLPWWWSDVDAEPEHVVTVPDPIATGALVGELELWVAEHAVGFTFVHAGAVEIDGRALLLPGRSMTGKTTLTLALVEGGAAYLSDEYAVLDPEGRVHAYPRPPSVRDESGARRRGPLPACVGDGPLEVGWVAALRFGDEWSVEPVTPSAIALSLIDNTVSVQNRPEEALRAIERALRGIQAWSGTRSDAADSAARLTALTTAQG